MSHRPLARIARRSRLPGLAPALLLSLALVACGDSGGSVPNNPTGTGSGPSSGPGSTSGAPNNCTPNVSGSQLCPPLQEQLSTNNCSPVASDFVPGSTTDPYPACTVDNGQYVLASSPPGSIGRVTAYETIANQLWNNAAPCPQNFIDARVAYTSPEGLESRVGRREDLHFPEVPLAEHDPGTAPDKQCRNPQVAARHPDRCAGPAKIAPIIASAFLAGIDNTVPDLNIPAAQIKAAMDWFFYLSVYKEAFTCFSVKEADCDSSWAYYTGGDFNPQTGPMLGFARTIKHLSPSAHQSIANAILAIRCVRELYPFAQYPKLDETFPPEGTALFGQAWEQLDNALHRGLAVVVRQHLQAGPSCADKYAANWAYLQILGPVLDREAIARDSVKGQELAAIWKEATPNAASMARAVMLLDELFACSTP